ncbi:programmed cell death protein 2-like [Antedon mediterranea]|uniref:programmed cell death protein 2-like n=1 Tax=Antedon mediterranea TaxID=105859 RepID=UPI003AF7DF15
MAAPMKVLLGMKDEVLITNNSNFLTNKIGGIPDWIYPNNLPNPLCKLCGATLYLISQVYCPLEGSKYYRTLYVFACANPSCWNQNGSWHVLRSQKLVTQVAKKPEPKVENVVMSSNDWCDDTEDWGNENDNWDASTDDWGQENATCEDMLSLQVEIHKEETKLDISEQSSLSVVKTKDSDEFSKQMFDLKLNENPVKFASFYMNVFAEPTENEHVVSEHERRLLKEYEQREGLDTMEWYESSNDRRKNTSKNEKYEKISATHGDQVFEKFLKRTRLCPVQCLRYSWDGSPLYIRKPQQTPLHQERCQYCGSKMTFELQLMPALVQMLKDKLNVGTTVEFGVVLVYTCNESCWNDGVTACREEVAIVQSDPDQDLFKSKQFE